MLKRHIAAAVRTKIYDKTKMKVYANIWKNTAAVGFILLTSLYWYNNKNGRIMYTDNEILSIPWCSRHAFKVL